MVVVVVVLVVLVVMVVLWVLGVFLLGLGLWKWWGVVEHLVAAVWRLGRCGLWSAAGNLGPPLFGLEDLRLPPLRSELSPWRCFADQVLGYG